MNIVHNCYPVRFTKEIKKKPVRVELMGYFQKKGVMTPPIVGYDTTLPQSLGLYRMLTYLMLHEANENHLLLHMSSGAAEFKRLRGGEQAIEYMGYYVKHLPFYRRFPWNTFSFLLNKFGKKILLRRKL